MAIFPVSCGLPVSTFNNEHILQTGCGCFYYYCYYYYGSLHSPPDILTGFDIFIHIQVLFEG